MPNWTILKFTEDPGSKFPNITVKIGISRYNSGENLFDIENRFNVYTCEVWVRNTMFLRNTLWSVVGLVLVLTLTLSGCGAITSSVASNPDAGVESLANPQFNDPNPLANGRTLVYGLDFEEDLIPLDDTLNPSKTLLYVDFGSSFKNNNTGPFAGWQRVPMRRLGSDYDGYVTGNVTRKTKETYPSWSNIPKKINRNIEIPITATGQNFVYVPDPFAGQTLDSGSFFIEFWMKPAQHESHAVRLFSKWDYPGFTQQRSFQIAYYHHNISVKVSPDGKKSKNFNSIHQNYIIPEKWNHVAVAFGPTELKIYINGTLNAVYDSGDGYQGFYSASTAPLIIGQGYQGAGLQNNFHGRMGQIRMMNGVLVDNNPSSLMRMSYGLYNEVAGAGMTGLTAFVDPGANGNWARFMAGNNQYNNNYKPSDDFVVYFPDDPTFGITRDFMASVDFRLTKVNDNRAHYILTKTHRIGTPDSFHFAITVLNGEARARLRSSGGEIKDLWIKDFPIEKDKWYRMNTAVDGDVFTLQVINTNNNASSNVTMNITGFTPDTSPGVISIGKRYGHSGDTYGYIDNVKLYRGGLQ